MKTATCHISGKELPLSKLVRVTDVRPGILELIKADHTDKEFDKLSYISLEELNKYRRRYLEKMLREEMGELSTIEEEVLKSINENEVMAVNIEPDLDKKFSFGDRLADRIAEFGGSWTFIICFFTVLFTWMATNFFLLTHPFDPYPFILLNLVLSCLAAIQAPIIMMSQNRQEAKDRMRSEHDYKVNLKAELEIRLLHEKVDHLMIQQNQRLLEIQQIQTDLLQDILTNVNNKNK